MDVDFNVQVHLGGRELQRQMIGVQQRGIRGESGAPTGVIPADGGGATGVDDGGAAADGTGGAGCDRGGH